MERNMELSLKHQNALKRVMDHIKTNKSLSMSTYDSFHKTTQVWASDSFDNSKDKSNSCIEDTDGVIYVNLKYSNFEEMYMYIDIRDMVVNISYAYDEDIAALKHESEITNDYWYADFTVPIFEKEEEYFQYLTTEENPLSIEENKMFIDFVVEFYKRKEKHIR